MEESTWWGSGGDLTRPVLGGHPTPPARNRTNVCWTSSRPRVFSACLPTKCHQASQPRRLAYLQTRSLAALQPCSLADSHPCRLAYLQTCILADSHTCRLLILAALQCNSVYFVKLKITNYKLVILGFTN